MQTSDFAMLSKLLVCPYLPNLGTFRSSVNNAIFTITKTHYECKAFKVPVYWINPSCFQYCLPSEMNLVNDLNYKIPENIAFYYFFLDGRWHETTRISNGIPTIGTRDRRVDKDAANKLEVFRRVLPGTDMQVVGLVDITGYYYMFQRTKDIYNVIFGGTFFNSFERVYDSN